MYFSALGLKSLSSLFFSLNLIKSANLIKLQLVEFVCKQLHFVFTFSPDTDKNLGYILSPVLFQHCAR